MIRGTPATFRFNLPYNFADLALAKIVFWQDNNDGPSTSRPLPIVKQLAHCSQGNDPKQLKVTLNSEETLRFSEKYKASAQCIVAPNEGDAVACRPQTITVYPLHDDAILEEILPASYYDEWAHIEGN